MTATTLSQQLTGCWARPGGVDGPYPLGAADDAPTRRRERRRDKATRWLALGGTSSQQMLRNVNALEAELRDASVHALRERLACVRAALAVGGVTPRAASECFALIREYSRRTLGLRHHDAQLRAGWALLNGRIAEMATGEGKTLSATLAAATAALAGTPVHVITVNDYLAARDAEKMMPLYDALDLDVGIVCEGDPTDQRRTAYARPVVYCSNKQLIFDFLQDQLAIGATAGATRLKLDRLYGEHGRSKDLLLRGLSFGIVDEADSVLIDEARTPMILARERTDEARIELYRQALDFAAELEQDRHFQLDRHTRHIVLSASGRSFARSLCESSGGPWRGQRHREQLLTLALGALHAYVLDEDYVVKDGKVCIVDGSTGRVLGDRSWQGGLQQLIELKEGCEPSNERETMARISQQRFFSRYLRLAGMSGTVREIRAELARVYGLSYERIPTHRPPRRRYLGEQVFASGDDKWRHIARRVRDVSNDGRPVLIGTRSIQDSERLSDVLSSAGLEHQVLNARQDAEEAAIIASAGQRGQITVATNMAGRGTDIALGPGVEALGGLHVIACERHEAGRIDRQLFGRAARQGDPGSCERLVSLDDELMTLFAPGWLRHGLRALAPRARVPGPLGRAAGALAQRRAERDRARQRKMVMEADRKRDQMLAFAGESR